MLYPIKVDFVPYTGILTVLTLHFADNSPSVSVFASIDNYTTMSLGNAVGSIICNTGLILGLVVIISPFKVDKNMFSSKSIILLISVLTLMVLGANRSISRGDGLILIVLLIVFMYSNIKSVSGKNRINSPNNMQSNSCDNIKSSKHENLKVGVLFVLGLIMMVVGSKLLVDNGVKIANSIGVQQGIISLTVIALGTSLPELVSSLTAIKKKHHGISVGNILGANILNIVSVIGISSLINDLPILSQNMRIDFEFMTIILLILILPTIKSGKLYRVQGLLLLSSYIIYITTLYFMYLA